MGGGRGGGIWQKITGTSASSNTVIVYWWWSHDFVDWVITHFNVIWSLCFEQLSQTLSENSNLYYSVWFEKVTFRMICHVPWMVKVYGPCNIYCITGPVQNHFWNYKQPCRHNSAKIIGPCQYVYKKSVSPVVALTVGHSLIQLGSGGS